MRRATFCLALVVAAVALADTPTDGVGRVSFGGGLRWTPNDYFNNRAKELGFPPLVAGDEKTTAPLGAQGLISFGYGAFQWLEVAVDLFAGYESFALDNKGGAFNSFTYGALIGVRLTRYDFPVRGLVPYLGVQTGPTLVTVSSPTVPGPERIVQGFSGNAGFAYRITDRIAVFLDVRYLYVRAFVADIAGRNVGGVFGSMGLSIIFPAAEQRDLEVPGFGSSSHL